MNAALLALAFVVQDTVVLKPVVVTATRFPVPVDIVASAVTVIGGAELRAQGIRSVAEALRQVPGVAVVETGSFGGQTSLFLRGGESDYVKVLLDGVPLNQAGGGLDLADLTTDNVDRIEIVRGPASVLYGSDAMTGVIQIFTRTGQGGPRVGAGAELRAGTYGTIDGAVDVSGGGSRVSYSARGSRFGSDGLYRYNNEYRNTVVSARVRVAPDARTDASLAYRWGDNTYHFPTNGAGQPVDSNQFSADRGPTLGMDVGRRFGAGFEVRAAGALRETRLGFEDRPDSPGEDGSFESRDLFRRSSAGALVTWRREGHVVTAGLEYEDERQRGRSVFSASFGTFPDSIGVRRWNTAYYAQALLGLERRMTIQLGTRLDDNSRFGKHATWRAGASYRPASRTRVRIAVGTGFKEPRFDETFARGFVTGNPHLAPERSTSWELGIERQIAGGRVVLGATYFDQRFRDLIEFSFTPIPPDSIRIFCGASNRVPQDSVNYCNVGGAGARGAEFEASLALGATLSLAASYTYVRTHVTDPGLDTLPDAAFAPGRRLLRRPTHAGAVTLTSALASRGSVALSARFVGDREDFDFSPPSGPRRVTMHPYVRVDLGGEYDVVRTEAAGPAGTLTVRLENLFNDGAPEIAGFRSRARTVLVGGRVALGP